MVERGWSGSSSDQANVVRSLDELWQKRIIREQAPNVYDFTHDKLREVTDGYQPPAEACTTWRALYHGLAVFEGEMHQHIHIENNILFPRALDS